MARIKRTPVSPEGIPGKSETFDVPLDRANRVIGAGVNNHTIYGLKKRGYAEYDLPDGSKFVFENLDMKKQPGYMGDVNGPGAEPDVP
jgi:hypothetical protein